MLVPAQRPSAPAAAAPRCLAHSRWLAECAVCTAHHLGRLRSAAVPATTPSAPASR